MTNKFRTIVAVGLASLLTGLASCERKPTQAESFYQAFPDSTHLRGAGTIEKYETPGAQHCLIHVKQMHRMGDPPSLIEQQERMKTIEGMIAEPYKHSPEVVRRAEEVLPLVKKGLEDARNNIRSSVEEVSTVQRDIYSILTSLHRQYGVTFVRAEGAERNLSSEDCINVTAAINTDLQDKGYLTEDEVFGKYLLYAGAEFAMGGASLLEVKAGESVELNEAAQDAWNKSGTYNIDAAEIYNPREDYVMKLVDDAREPYSVVVFGAKHDFRDNVERWNKEYPEDKFSLIVVTPAAYKEKDK